jgi:hypothetical protein
MRTCPVCSAQCGNVLDLLSHLGGHAPEERAAASRSKVADLRELLRAIRKRDERNQTLALVPLPSCCLD